MLLAVLVVTVGVVVLGVLVAWTAARARRLGRVRAQVGTALAVRLAALSPVRRAVNGGGTATASEPSAPPAR